MSANLHELDEQSLVAFSEELWVQLNAALTNCLKKAGQQKIPVDFLVRASVAGVFDFMIARSPSRAQISAETYEDFQRMILKAAMAIMEVSYQEWLEGVIEVQKNVH